MALTACWSGQRPVIAATAARSTSRRRQPRVVAAAAPPQHGRTAWASSSRSSDVAPSSSSSSLSSRRRLARHTCAAAALPEAPAAELEPAAQEQWAECSTMLQERCGLDAAAADAALLKAFGWKGQAFWRQERVKQAPCPEQVEASLDFLQELGVVGDDAAALLAAFPEALGLKVELMSDNVQVLRDKWYMKGNVLVSAVKRKPRVLGNIIDCEGNCAGLCTRCWAQF